MSTLFVLLLLCLAAAVAAQLKRAIYVLNTNNAVYVACSMPGLRRYAAAYGWPLHEMTSSALQRRRASRLNSMKRLRLTNNRVNHSIDALADLDSDGHFAKLQVFADAVERGYDEILYIDVDVVLNEKTNIPNVFESANLDSAAPSIALYGQPAPKDAIVDAIFRINPRLTTAGLDRASLLYWNTGVVVINRSAMLRLKPLVELLFASYVSRGFSIANLPFFDQGFINSILWDPSFGFVVRALSFAWNTSHSKYFYNHGDKFWLKEPAYRSAQFVPFVFHFMGCAGRNATATAGEQCKYERMQQFAKSHLSMVC